MDSGAPDQSGVQDRTLDEEKAARRTLRAIKQKGSSSSQEQEQAAPLAAGSFAATIRHFSGLFLCHKEGEKKLGAVQDVDESCSFLFEPFKDVQMGRHRFGYRVKTAQNSYLVAVLGRRCTSRLVPVSEVPPPTDQQAHHKFFMEQTNLFEIGNDRKKKKKV